MLPAHAQDVATKLATRRPPVEGFERSHRHLRRDAACLKTTVAELTMRDVFFSLHTPSAFHLCEAAQCSHDRSMGAQFSKEREWQSSELDRHLHQSQLPCRRPRRAAQLEAGIGTPGAPAESSQFPTCFFDSLDSLVLMVGSGWVGVPEIVRNCLFPTGLQCPRLIA